MNNKVFTIQELMETKFYELPNAIYNLIVNDLEKLFGSYIGKVLPILNNAPVMQIDQYVDVYKYILVI